MLSLLYLLKMARFLIVNTNREHGPFPIPPIGACQVAGYAASTGHEVDFLDLCFEHDPERAMLKRLRARPPDLIGLSIRNIDNSNMAHTRFYLPFVRGLVDAVRRVSQSPIIAGGAAVSVAPRPVMEYVGADFAVSGEGELAVAGLLSGCSPADLPGLLWRAQGDGPLTQNAGTTRPVPPETRERMWRWVNTDKYLRRNAPLPFQSKRGCVFRCVYCTYTNVEGTSYRLKGAKEAAAELAANTRATGARRVEFVDATFNVPETFALDLCEAILESQDLSGITFTTSGFNPSVHSPELFGLMERIGFTSVVCTPESASDTVLHSMRKGFTTYHLARTIEERRRRRIPFLWVFLLGGPGETERTVEETFRFIAANVPAEDGVFLTTGVRVYPGTELAEISGYAGDLIEPRFYVSPSVDPAWLAGRVRDEMRRHTNYVTISDTQNRLLPALNRLLGALRSHLPLWRFAPTVNRVRNLRSQL